MILSLVRILGKNKLLILIKLLMKIEYIISLLMLLNTQILLTRDTINFTKDENFSYLLQKKVTNKTIRITIFVHGSLFTVLSLLNIADVYRDSLHENHIYKKLLAIIRTNQLLEHEQLIFDLDDHMLDSILTAPVTMQGYSKIEAKKAGNFILPAYHTFTKIARPDEDVCYVSWGHYGLLSQRYRKEVAQNIYHWICALRDYYLGFYETVLIDGVGHSHGGNILLNLAHYEIVYNKKLTIDNLILFGTPIQKETALFAYTHVFNRVVNCYAEHDVFQTADWLSTSKHKSFNKFSEKKLLIERPEQHKVFDIRFSYNNSFDTVNHANMWCLGRCALGGPSLGDLPLVILSPIMLSLLDKNLDNINDKNHCLDLCIQDIPEKFFLKLAEKDSTKMLETNNLASTIKPISELVNLYWRPDYRCYLPVFNKKTLTLLTNAFYKLYFE